MVAGLKLALVIRAKDGPNLLIQTQGIGGRAVQDATGEVAATLSRVAAGVPLLDGSGDNAPSLAAGCLKPVQGRYSVTYRLVNAVWVMVVAGPTANVFLCMQLVDAAAKVLVGVAKGVDVTPDRVIKRYTEVYTLLDRLLSGGFAELPPAFIHRSATDGRMFTLPASAADAARRFKTLMRGSSKSALGAAAAPGAACTPSSTGKGSGPSPRPSAVPGASSVAGTPRGDSGTDPTPPPVPETPSQRGGAAFAPEEADPLAKVEFEVPADALPPPPARAAVARRAAPAFLEAQRPTPPPPAFMGAVAEEADAAAAPAGFAAFPEPAAAEAEKAAAAAAAAANEANDWATFREEAAAEAAAAAAAAAAAPPPQQQPAITDKDVQDSLQLVEVWRAEVAGARLVRAGVEGMVRRKLAPYGLKAAVFRVLPSQSAVVNACLRAAHMNRQYSERLGGGDSGFIATFHQASVGCAYLKYMLPALACAPPLQAQLCVLPGSDAAGAWQGLVVLRYTANPRLPAALLDVVVEVVLPPEVAGLARTSPSGQWNSRQHRLRWVLPRVLPGGEGMLRVVVSGRKDVAHEAATAALQQNCTATLLFSLRPGRSMSGLGFEASLPEEGAPALPAHIQCFGEMRLKP